MSVMQGSLVWINIKLFVQGIHKVDFDYRARLHGYGLEEIGGHLDAVIGRALEKNLLPDQYELHVRFS